MVRYVHAAEQPSVEDKLNDDLNQLKDDFDFAIAGIEKIAADGDFGRASELVNSLSGLVNGSIDEITGSISAEPAPAGE